MREHAKIIALLTDFGLNDHFVGTMKGVILKVDPEIGIYDITHSIQPQNILEAAYTLSDTLPYWPEKTIMVAVVDPGVGTDRRSIVVKTKSGHTIICPDNGILSLINEDPGIAVIIEINEELSRLQESDHYHTFHGRDIYAYNAARLASGKVAMIDLGSESGKPIHLLPEHSAYYVDNEYLSGRIVKIEKPFGNIVTNISEKLIQNLQIAHEDIIQYTISKDNQKRLEGELPFVRTFGDVNEYKALIYIDSSGRLGFAINKGDFSEHFQIAAGLSWEIKIRRLGSGRSENMKAKSQVQ